MAMVRNNFSCTGDESKLVDCIGTGSESDNRTCERNNSAGVTCVIPLGELKQTFNVMNLYTLLQSLDSKKDSGLSSSKIVGAVLGVLLFVSAVIATVLIIKWRITRKVLLMPLMQAVLDIVLLLPYYFRCGKRAAPLHITTSTKSDRELESHFMEKDTKVDSQSNQYSVSFMQPRIHNQISYCVTTQPNGGTIATCPGIQQSRF